MKSAVTAVKRVLEVVPYLSPKAVSLNWMEKPVGQSVGSVQRGSLIGCSVLLVAGWFNGC